MVQTIQLRRSTTAGNAPSSLVTGEMAINETDRALFYRDPGGAVANWRCTETLLANGAAVNSAGLVLQLPSTFKQFRVRGIKSLTRAAADDDLYARLSINAGSTFITTTSYAYAYFYANSTTTPFYSYSYSGAGGDSAIFMGYNSKAYSAGFEFFLNHEVIASNHYVNGWVRNADYGGVYYQTVVWGYSVAGNVNAIKFYGLSANIDLTYALYGVMTG